MPSSGLPLHRTFGPSHLSNMSIVRTAKIFIRYYKVSALAVPKRSVIDQVSSQP